MKVSFTVKQKSHSYRTQQIKHPDIICTVCTCLEELTTEEQLKHMGAEVFEPIPHVDDLPMDVYC